MSAAQAPLMEDIKLHRDGITLQLAVKNEDSPKLLLLFSSAPTYPATHLNLKQ